MEPWASTGKRRNYELGTLVSCQMDCSDEGLMQEEIEDCLRPVISAVAKSSGASDWALGMMGQDSTGCIRRGELTALAEANNRN